MDNLRSLNTSLPSTSSPRRQPSQPPELLLQQFKDAALNVTNLYKTAAAQHQSRYNEGYQDALEELLNFLDSKNLGLQDGEGWSVRQWATERFNGTTAAATTSTSESDEEAEAENRARSSSPVIQRKASREQLQTPTHHAQATPAAATTTISPPHSRSESAPPVAPTVTEQAPREQAHTCMIPPQAEFTFQSSHQYPSVHDIDMDNSDSEGIGSPAGSTLHVNIHRPRHNSRHSNRNNRSSNNTTNNNRSSSNTSLGPGAGMKRRQPTADFFDLGGFNGKDHTGGGGKRSRFT